MIFDWIRTRGERFLSIAWEFSSSVFFLVILLTCCGWFGWSIFVEDSPRAERQRQERREARQAAREKRREVSTVWTAWTARRGKVEGVAFDALDPAQVPESERYAWQPDGLVAVLGSHSGRHWSHLGVTGVCWTTGGRIVSCGTDEYVRVWQADSMRGLFALHCPPHGLGVACSPDGCLIAACGWDEGEAEGWLRLWRRTGEEFEEALTLTWDNNEVGAVAFSPDGRWLAAGGGHHSIFDPDESHGWVQLWAVGDDPDRPVREVWTFSEPDAPVCALAFSRDGRTLAAGGDDRMIRVWDLEAGSVTQWYRVKTAMLLGGAALVLLRVVLSLWRAGLAWRAERRAKREGLSVEASPPAKGRRVPLVFVGIFLVMAGWVTGSAGPEMSWPTRMARRSKVTALAFSPTGGWLASGDVQGEVRRCHVFGRDVGSSERGSNVPEGEKVPVLALSFSPDGKTLASGHRRPFVTDKELEDWKPPADREPGALRLWKVGPKLEFQRGILPRSESARAVAFSPDGRQLIAATAPQSWNPTFDRKPSAVWKQIEWIPREHEPLAAAVRGQRLRRWVLADGEAREQTPDREGLFFDGVRLATTGRPLLTNRDSYGCFERWEPANGRLRSTSLGGQVPLPCRPEGHSARGSRDGRFFVLQTAGWKEEYLREEEKAFVLPHSKEQADEKAKWIFVGYALYEGDRRIFTRHCWWAEKSATAQEGAAFATDGSALLWWLGGHEVHLWDLRDRPGEVAVLKGFEGEASSATLSGRHDGWLAVGTTTGVVHLWRYSPGKAPEGRKDLKGLAEAVARLGWSADGKALVAWCAANGNVKVWDVSGGEPRCVIEEKPTSELTADEKKWLGIVDWQYRMHARFEKSRITVQREEPGGGRETVQEWSPPGDVTSMHFSSDGRHLVVRNDDGTVHVVRLDPDGRLLAACDAVLAREKDDMPALIERARVRLRRGELHLALEDAERAMSKDAGSVEGWRLRGLAYARRGDHRIAEQCFTALLKLRPQDAAALHRRGLSRAERGDHAGARSDFAAALKIDPEIARRPAR